MMNQIEFICTIDQRSAGINDSAEGQYRRTAGQWGARIDSASGKE